MHETLAGAMQDVAVKLASAERAMGTEIAWQIERMKRVRNLGKALSESDGTLDARGKAQHLSRCPGPIRTCATLIGGLWVATGRHCMACGQHWGLPDSDDDQKQERI